MVREADLTSSRKLIPDLATWWQCFAIYTAVRTDEHPERTKVLLAYGTTIAKASLKYRWPAWIVYDQNFRLEATDNAIMDWSKVDPSICFTNTAISGENWCRFCQSVEHTAESCPSCPSQGAKKRSLSTPPPPPPVKKRPAPHSVNAACREYNWLDGA